MGGLTSVVAEPLQSKTMLFTDMKIMTSRKVDIQLPGDKSTPCISGCAFLSDGQAILCDYFNSNIKVLNGDFRVSDVLQLPSLPWDVSLLNNSNAVITLPNKMQIQFLQILPKLKTKAVIQLDKCCYGVEVADEEIFVTFHDGWQKGEVRVLDMAGNCKRGLHLNQDETSMFKTPYYVTLNADTATLYVSDVVAHTVTSLKADGSVINTCWDTRNPTGICVDGDGNAVVCDMGSHDVYIVTADGIKSKILLTAKDGISIPYCVAYKDSTLLVGLNDTKLFVYTVE